MYGVVQVFLEPRQLGHCGVRRKRTFIYLYHVEKTRYLYDVFDALNMIENQVCQKVQTRPRDYLVSSRAARQLHNFEFAGKRKLQYRPDPWLGMVRLAFSYNAQGTQKCKLA